MTVRSGDGSLEYKYYDESEWRIIYSNDIKDHLSQVGMNNINRHFIPRNDIDDPSFLEYLQLSNADKRPEYLLPFTRDRWFSLIIYPSLSVKIESEADNEIRKLIEHFKPCKPESIGHCEGAGAEIYNKPIEINLDSCRNF